MHELNLLPPLRRHLLKRDVLLAASTTVLHRLIIIAFVLGVAGVSALGALWLVQRKETPSQELQERVTAYQVLRRKIISRNAQVDGIQAVTTKRLVWSEQLGSILAVLPPGMVLTNVDGNFADATLVLKGQAPNRNAIIVTTERLAALPQVVRIEAPSTNLLQRERPVFQFIVHLAASASVTPHPSPIVSPPIVPSPVVSSSTPAPAR